MFKPNNSGSAMYLTPFRQVKSLSFPTGKNAEWKKKKPTQFKSNELS